MKTKANKFLQRRKIRHCFILFIVCIQIIMLLGCGKKEISSSEKKFNSSLGVCENSFYYNLNHCIAETDKGYFITNSGILHYLDKETGKIIIFSNDAITADQLVGDYFSENRKYEGHEAYFGDTSIFYYNDHLYTLKSVDISKGKWQLLKLDPATMQREVLAEINSTTGNFAIVNDKVYTMFQEIENNHEINSNNIDNQINENQYISTYFLSVYDLKVEEAEEDIEIPVSQDFKEKQIAYPRYHVAGDVLYFDMSYSAGNGKEGYREKRILGAYNTLTGNFNFETMLDFPQDKKKAIRNIVHLKNVQYYSYFALPDLSVAEPDIMKEKDAWYIKIDGEGTRNKDELNKISLPQDYYLETNGTDIYAVPAAVWDFAKNQAKAFDIYKMVDGELVSVCGIDANEAEKIRTPMDICITTNGDIFLMNTAALYQISDDKVIVKFDYEDIPLRYSG